MEEANRALKIVFSFLVFCVFFGAMVAGSWNKKLPFPIWSWRWVMIIVAASTYVAVLFYFLLPKVRGEARPKNYQGGDWIRFSDLVGDDNQFRPCPVCSGQVVVGVGDWLLPVSIGNPYCWVCRTSFPRKKNYLRDGFTVVPPASK